MSVIYDFNSFDTKNITITPPRVLSSGSKASYLNYSRESLIFQTPQNLNVPFGLNVFQDANSSAPPKYSLNLSFRGADANPEIKAFQEAIQKLDEFMLKEGVKNSKAWFGKEKSAEVINEFHTKCLKAAKDPSYAPTMKINLRKVDGKFTTKVYTADLKPSAVPLDELLTKNAQVTAIIKCTGVWMSNVGFGLTWNVEQIVINKTQERMSDFAFHGIKAASPAAASASASSSAASTNSFAALEEENEIEDDAAFSAPAPSSVLAAVMPQAAAPAVSQSIDEEPEDHEPVPAPKKVLKKVIKK